LRAAALRHAPALVHLGMASSEIGIKGLRALRAAAAALRRDLSIDTAAL
jgi:hypothetical protein